MLVEIDLDGRGGRTSRPGSRSTTTCWPSSAGTAASTSPSGPRATWRSTRTTPSRTPRSRWARRSGRRSATRPGSAGSATRWCRWTSRSPRSRSTCPAGRYLVHVEPDGMPPTIGPVYATTLTRHVFESFVHNAQDRAARAGARRAGRAPHRGGAVQGGRPRPARRDRASTRGSPASRAPRACCDRIRRGGCEHPSRRRRSPQGARGRSGRGEGRGAGLRLGQPALGRAGAGPGRRRRRR